MNNLALRTISGLVYISFLIGAILLSAEASMVILLGFMGFCLFEFYKLYKIEKAFIPVFLASAAFIVAHQFAKNPLPYYLFSTLLLSLFTFSKLNFEQIKSAGFGLIYILIPFFLAINLGFEDFEQPYLLLALFSSIWVNDTFAYLIGRALGRHKLYPSLSPGKTIEGFIGGLVICAAWGYGLSLYYGEQIWLLVAPVIGVASTVGDLFESKLKRELGIKDSSNLIPGHGGFLDRLDSFLLAMPLFYLIITW